MISSTMPGLTWPLVIAIALLPVAMLVVLSAPAWLVIAFLPDRPQRAVLWLARQLQTWHPRPARIAAWPTWPGRRANRAELRGTTEPATLLPTLTLTNGVKVGNITAWNQQ